MLERFTLEEIDQIKVELGSIDLATYRKLAVISLLPESPLLK